ncbi:hypothetical protein MRB53_021255 [Persea americana]|uniref:Uncharacterized protein n=1 Tax=Persea americana TaxID=3435 RepID=A0ACC2L3K9_PERAE|nr:hypothetical protein MRB53_021255 [Persea americana]
MQRDSRIQGSLLVLFAGVCGLRGYRRKEDLGSPPPSLPVSSVSDVAVAACVAGEKEEDHRGCCRTGKKRIQRIQALLCSSLPLFIAGLEEDSRAVDAASSTFCVGGENHRKVNT